MLRMSSEFNTKESDWMSNPMGHVRWAIAEGSIPASSHGPEPQMTSHETVCLLNTSDRDAHVDITIFFSDRDPAGPYRVTVPARRTRHVRFNNFDDPEPIRLRDRSLMAGRLRLCIARGRRREPWSPGNGSVPLIG